MFILITTSHIASILAFAFLIYIAKTRGSGPVWPLSVTLVTLQVAFMVATWGMAVHLRNEKSKAEKDVLGS